MQADACGQIGFHVDWPVEATESMDLHIRSSMTESVTPGYNNYSLQGRETSFRRL